MWGREGVKSFSKAFARNQFREKLSWIKKLFQSALCQMGISTLEAFLPQIYLSTNLEDSEAIKLLSLQFAMLCLDGQINSLKKFRA